MPEPLNPTAAACLPRNKAFLATHDLLIETAVKVISRMGVDALSMAAIAREASVSRATLYYHFSDREHLLAAVMEWSSKQLTRGFTAPTPRLERMEGISRFVLDNPALITTWIEDFITQGNIRDRYPEWDALVASIQLHLLPHANAVDPEVYCTIMLTAAFVAPLVFHSSVRPDLSIDAVVELFTREQARVFARDTRTPRDDDI